MRPPATRNKLRAPGNTVFAVLSLNFEVRRGAEGSFVRVLRISMVRVATIVLRDLEDFKAVTNGLSMIENLADAWKQRQKWSCF